MFGNMQDGFLKQMQEAYESGKRNLDEKSVFGDAGGGLVSIELTGNRRLKSFKINANLQDITVEDLEDFIAVSLSKALEAANKLNEEEMAKNARLFMP